jgi:hypothetical protein
MKHEGRQSERKKERRRSKVIREMESKNALNSDKEEKFNKRKQDQKYNL